MCITQYTKCVLLNFKNLNSSKLYRSELLRALLELQKNNEINNY